jgi:transglutaminase-like putative cysteine protease
VRERLARVAPSVIASAALAAASGLPLAPSLAATLMLFAALLRPRVPLDAVTQRLAAVVIVILTIAGIRASGISVHGPRLGAFGYGVALTPLLVAAVRSWIDQAEGGPRADAALALISLLATGAARPGAGYAAATVLFVASLVGVQRALDPLRPPLSAISVRTRSVGAAIVVSSLIASAVSALLAQLAYAQVRKRFQHAFESPYEEAMGLGDAARLGNIAPLLRSDAVVLRITGPEVDRLRGVVLDEYGGGRWTKAKVVDPAPLDVPVTRPVSADVVEVRHVDPDRGYVFLPLEARDVAAPIGRLLVDSNGAARVSMTTQPITVWFRRGPRDSMRVAEPQPADLLMPHNLRVPLTALATEWTAEARAPAQRVTAIRTHLLQGFRYSLDPIPPTRLDAVLDFLTASRRGDCEYFASAFVLLARSLGIPARLVLGYRVGERNPYFGHYVVRRRNAHAWAEAYLPDQGWITVDPTPMTELPQDLEHDELGLQAAFEVLAVGWERVEARLAELTVFELGGAAILGIAIFALLRWWRNRRSRAAGALDGLDFDPPPRAFALLAARLGERGSGRRPAETIEQWAARLDDPKVRARLLRYAEARYGSPDPRAAEEVLAEPEARRT